MHVIQSQLVNYSYDNHSQKNIKLVRWWILGNDHESLAGDEIILPFNKEQEDIFFKFMDDHPANFPPGKRERFDSQNLKIPDLDYKDLESDIEKPCILLIRAKADNKITGLCRRMDIVLQNDELSIQLPFDLAGEIILEHV
ncbi:MAG: hypothetical protein QM737_16160 [Ferruginibacter sp.]